jgi:hypothetical protein
VGRPLEPEEKQALVDLCYTLSKNVHGDDIASPPTAKGHFNDALSYYHRAVCVPTMTHANYYTWHQRLLRMN